MRPFSSDEKKKFVNHLQTISGYAKKINGNSTKTKAIHKKRMLFRANTGHQCVSAAQQPTAQRENKAAREKRPKYTHTWITVLFQVSENESGYVKPTETMYYDGWCFIRRWKWKKHRGPAQWVVFTRNVPFRLLYLNNIWTLKFHMLVIWPVSFLFCLLFSHAFCAACVWVYVLPTIFRNFNSPRRSSSQECVWSCTIARMCNYWISFPWWKSWFSMHWNGRANCLQKSARKCLLLIGPLRVLLFIFIIDHFHPDKNFNFPVHCSY